LLIRPAKVCFKIGMSFTRVDVLRIASAPLCVTAFGLSKNRELTSIDRSDRLPLYERVLPIKVCEEVSTSCFRLGRPKLLH
jgi:hypothetical protein